MNNDEWMLGIHVTNQSVENGSMPLGGDLPRSSLYRRSRRSRESLVSASSTCRRAPSSISALARATSRASSTTLLPRMVSSCGRTEAHQLFRGHHLRRLGERLRHEDRGMNARYAALGPRPEQQVPHDLVVETKAAHEHVGSGYLHDLRRRKIGEHMGHFLAHAQAKHRFGAILANQSLRKNQVSEIRFTDVVEHLIGLQELLPRLSSPADVPATAYIDAIAHLL